MEVELGAVKIVIESIKLPLTTLIQLPKLNKMLWTRALASL